MGGRSVENEVSFNSGRTVCDHIDSSLYDVVPVFQTLAGGLFLLPWHFLHRGKIADFEDRLENEAERVSWDNLKKHIDFVFVAVHGRYAEDGILQGTLEVFGIPYLGAKVLGSALRLDKSVHRECLRVHGVAVPRGLKLFANEAESLSLEKILKKLKKKDLDFPLVVRPVAEGSSLGIGVVHKEKELRAALVKASIGEVTCRQPVLIEEYICGMEFSCIVLQKPDGTWFPLSITEVVPEEGTTFFDYEQKYMPGRATKITPARCSEENKRDIESICINVAEVLDFTIMGRIDGFLKPDGKIVIIDPNSLSGMAPSSFVFHQAAEVGMSHSQLINYLVETELEVSGMISEVSRQKKMAGKKSKKRIAVLLGGNSNEREISLESGRNICYKLSPSKYEVMPLFVSEKMDLYHLSPRLLIQNSTREIAELISDDIKVSWSSLPMLCDFVFSGLHGGKGENGSIQGILEMLDLPYNGSPVLPSALCMDKFKTNEFLRENGFSIPVARLVSREDFLNIKEDCNKDLINRLLTGVAFPVIVKPHDDGCSMFVEKASCDKDLLCAMENIFKHGKDKVLLEEFVEGTELTCGVYGNDKVIALPPSKVVSQHEILSITEKFLPGAGENQTPAPLPSEILVMIKTEMTRAYKAIGCKGYARIDCFYQDAQTSPTKKERVVILEVNSLPALTPATCLFHQAAETGMRPMEFLDKIIDLGLELHQEKIIDFGFKEKEALSL